MKDSDIILNDMTTKEEWLGICLSRELVDKGYKPYYYKNKAKVFVNINNFYFMLIPIIDRVNKKIIFQIWVKNSWYGDGLKKCLISVTYPYNRRNFCPVNVYDAFRKHTDFWQRFDDFISTNK